MIIDAVVLAGGRATRLDGASKPQLLAGSRSLLASTLSAVGRSRRIVVVGESSALLDDEHEFAVVREEPAFAGPAAAIAAGLAALDDSDFTIVVACDMPGVAGAIDALLGSLAPDSDGVVAVSTDGREQPLVGIYSTAALRESARRHLAAGDLANLSVRALLAGLSPARVAVPDGSTDDVDTWWDAARLGITRPSHPDPLVDRSASSSPVHKSKERPMADASSSSDTDAILREWSATLVKRLELDGVVVDVDAVLSLAGEVAHAVVRPAAPLTAFVVGYAAGRAASDGATIDEAFASAAAIARDAARDFSSAS